jgi:formiminoglutamase
VGDARRWHQVVTPWRDAAPPGIAILGFACDAGVARNQGRVGAAAGPQVLRRALAGLAWHGGATHHLYDAGDVPCTDGQLESAQQALAENVHKLLAAGHVPLLLGGGHEIAWGSYQALAKHAAAQRLRLGVINIDAHLDLRPLLPGGLGSSGTPFRQIATAMQASGQAVRYLCLGVARPANTVALFDAARDLGVSWVEDVDCLSDALGSHATLIQNFVASVDLLQLSVCLDVFPAGLAPGVSAPAALGVPPAKVLAAIRSIGQAARLGPARSKLAIAEIAELNPQYDDAAGSTARLGARVAFELVGASLGSISAT